MSPSKWPQLQSLCGGYLHQDFVAEHGTASHAAQAWLAAATPAEARQLSAEWRTFLNVTRGMSVADRAAALRALVGGSWAPATDLEFEAVSVLLIDAGQQ